MRVGRAALARRHRLIAPVCGPLCGLAFINSIGTLGGFVGPYMMGAFKDATGGFTTGILAMAGVMIVTTALAASLKLVVRQE